MDTATVITAEEVDAKGVELYAFDAPEFHIKFPFGDSTVVHKLRRPSKSIRAGGKMINEYNEWLRQVTYQSKPYDKHNNSIISDNATADQWFWDRLAVNISGYPGMGSEPIEVTPEIAKRMRGSHKEHAIGILYEGTAVILEDRTQLTFDGGTWVVRLDIGPESSPTHQIEFTLREWEEPERRRFKRESHAVLTPRDGGREGMTVISSLDGSERLFDAIFISCNGGVVAGQEFNGQREAFITAIDPYWKYKVVGVLTRHWNENRQD